jgi:DNA polymerase I-like protein with 3'-5' exonuclease and polymerase domains
MIFIDFEYNGVNQRLLNLVCVSVNFKGKIKSLWLETGENKEALKRFILKYKDETFVAYNVAAEAHAFISLGLDPLDFKWIDLMLEYKMLQNCNNKYLYGHQLIRGKEKVTQPKPEWYDDLESDLDGTESNKEISDKLTEKYEGKFAEGESNLAACCYRLLNKKIDTYHKTKMRDLIIAGGPFTEQDQKDITKYCESDVELLPSLLKTMEALQGKSPTIEIHDRHYRGKVGAIAGKLTSEGYPVDRQKVEIFQKNIDIAQFNLCETINKQVGKELFKFSPKSKKHVKNMLLLQEEIHSRFKDAWPLTKTQKYKVDSKTFDKMIPTKYSYKDGDLLEQYIRFNSFDSSVKSLRKSEGDRNFLNYVGPDNRARSWLSPYGAQSGRFQPKSTSFLFLKAAWLRSLCVPAPGRVIIGMDYSQQEFLLGGCISGDKKIWETYQTGDIYSDFGRQVGMVTAEKGTADFKIQRSAAKGAILGISYGMQSKSLARNISASGLETSDKEAQRIIDAYYELYSDYKKYREQILDDYAKKGYLQLADGWTIYGDNGSKLSLLNVPIQGMGSCILRKAIEFCYEEKLTPIIPLHDALYIEAPLESWKDHAEALRLCMKSANAFYFEGEPKQWAMNVRIDAEAWGSDLDAGEVQLSDFKIKTEKIHIDERAETDYKEFKRYFEPIAESEVEAYKKEVNKKSYVDGKKQVTLWD